MEPTTTTQFLQTVRTATSKPTILCVEDEKSLLDALEYQLESKFGDNFRIAKAESGVEALEYLEELLERGQEISVIISDFFMPGGGMHGDEFLIRAHKLVPKAMKIMLTGRAELDNVTRIINHANLYRFLNKPWDAEDLRLTVEEATKSYLSEKLIREQNRVLGLLADSTEAISRSLDIGVMLRELMRILLDLSGAERMGVIISLGGKLAVEGYSVAGQANPRVEMNEPVDQADYLCQAIVRKVEQTLQPVVERNCLHASEFKDDAYVKANKVHSVVALPVINLGNLIGIIYLEHRERPNFFTEDKVRIISLLATKSAIAIENAYMFNSLEEIVETRTHKLNDTLSELMAMSSRKDKIINIVSHDIRSPLSGIGELARTLRDADIAADKEEVMRFGGIIQRSVSEILKFVNDILDVAKLESGQVFLNAEVVELKPYLNSLLDFNRAQTASKGIQLTTSGEEKIMVELDRSKLAQAINNLLSNAIKFTPKGGNVILSYDLATEHGHSVARIRVADTGVGIPKADLPYVFEKFTKAQRSGTKGEKGTGLGLSIVKEVVELHNGRIEVDSDEGMGTTFTLTIPLKQSVAN